MSAKDRSISLLRATTSPLTRRQAQTDTSRYTICLRHPSHETKMSTMVHRKTRRSPERYEASHDDVPPSTARPHPSRRLSAFQSTTGASTVISSGSKLARHESYALPDKSPKQPSSIANDDGTEATINIPHIESMAYFRPMARSSSMVRCSSMIRFSSMVRFSSIV